MRNLQKASRELGVWKKSPQMVSQNIQSLKVIAHSEGSQCDGMLSLVPFTQGDIEATFCS